MMTKLLRNIPWVFLLPVAIVLGLAPFKPEPHLVEKLKMLISGQLVKPVDIFDLLMHGAPTLLVLLKYILGRAVPSQTE
jgi:hypothetical protein